jgi:hypothetical protein
MWQQIVVVVIVLGAALYAAWLLAPKQWRKRFGLAVGERGEMATSESEAGAGAGAGATAAKSACGCGAGKDGCH